MSYPEFILWLEHIRLEKGISKQDAPPEGVAPSSPGGGPADSFKVQLMLANFRRLTAGRKPAK